jgi:hypothetical protein
MLPLGGYSQVSFFLDEFTNVQQATWEMNQFISMSQQKGNLAKAQSVIATDSSSFPAHQKRALLTYQLYGEDSLQALSPSVKISAEQEAYVQMWVRYIAGDKKEAGETAKTFGEIYPESRLLLRFEIKRYMDFIMANAFNKDKERQTLLLQQIDSCFSDVPLTVDEYIFFSLARMDIAESNLLKRSDSRDFVLFPRLCALWEQYPEKLDAPHLLKELEPCEDSLCTAIKQELQKQIWEEQGLAPPQIMGREVTRIAKAYEKAKSHASQLEKALPLWEVSLTERIIAAQDDQERELMKAMTSAALSPVEGALYQKLSPMLSKDFVKVPFSDELKSLLAPELPREQLKSLSMAYVDSLAQALGRKMTAPTGPDEEEVSRNDFFFFLGYLLYSKDIIDGQKRMLTAFTQFSQTKPSPAQLSSWKHFQGVWEQNPFYLETVNPYAQYYFPRVEDGASLDSALWAIDQSLRSYPACVNLIKLKLIFLQQYAAYYEDQGALAYELIETTIKLFTLRPDEGRQDRKSESFRDYLIPIDVEWMETYWDNDQVMETLLGLMSAEQKAELKALLEEKLEERPEQGNLEQMGKYFE